MVPERGNRKKTMGKLDTSYMGLRIRNPFVASSSGLTSNLDRLQSLRDAGIGAVVLKSLFEEQLSNQAFHMQDGANAPEAFDYLQHYVRSHGVDEYVTMLRDACRTLDVPVIASINCVTDGQWVEFARRLEDAGADALELNIYHLPTNRMVSSAELEARYFDTVERVREAVSFPIAVKLSSQFTSPLYMLDQLRQRGVNGAVLFNRYYEPDVSLSDLTLTSAGTFSHPGEYHNTLRWLGMAWSQLPDLDLAISTGIHSGYDAAKAIAAGASAVQLCTVLYQHGPNYVKHLLDELEFALAETGKGSVASLLGSLKHMSAEGALIFERSQFMRYFSSYEE